LSVSCRRSRFELRDDRRRGFAELEGDRSGLPIPLGKRSQAAYLKRPAEALCDVKRDPDALINLAANPAHAAVREGLRAQLLEMRKVRAALGWQDRPIRTAIWRDQRAETDQHQAKDFR
jgi:hypothetical protein